jgi:hypothetical protein
MTSELLTQAWASDVVELLRHDERFRREASTFSGNVRLASDRRCVWFRFEGGGIASIGADASADFRCGLRADQAGWRELLTADGASLNKLLRQGRIFLDGDEVAALRSWKLLFLMAEAGRRAAVSPMGSTDATSGGEPCRI